MSSPKPRLVYAFDPLCGWCFAFTDSVRVLRRELGSRVQWEVACGGLVRGARVGPIAGAADYLEKGMAAVESRTPARFGAGYRQVLEDGRWISNSEPPCRAVLLVQDRWGGAAAVDFGHALCHGFYADGHLPDDPESLRRAARAATIDGEALVRVWSSHEAHRRTELGFESARRQGLDTYPTLRLVLAGRSIPVVSGYAPPDDALRAVKSGLDALSASA